MAENILKFSSNTYLNTVTGQDIVAEATKLAKMSGLKYSGVKVDGYNELNERVKASILKYASERCNLDPAFNDVSKREGWIATFNDVPEFQRVYFSVVKEVAKALNSKVTMQELLPFANIMSVAEGDSINTRIKNNRLFKVETVGYSSNRSLAQFSFDDNQTMTPVRKEAKIAFDLYQLTALDYDFGDLLRRLALSFQVALQTEICNAVFGDANPTHTPFVLATFDQEKFIAMAERIGKINGSPAMAYATKIALGRIAGGVADKYYYGGKVGDAVISKGYIESPFGVPSMVLDQSVDTTTNNYNFNIPNNKIIIASAGQQIADVLMEGSYQILEDDGQANNIQQKQYKMMTAWDVKSTAKQGAFGIQIVGNALL